MADEHDYFYRWGKKRDIKKLSDHGYNSKTDDWLWVLFGDETGGLTEYILGRKGVEEGVWGVRFHKSALHAGNCYMNPDGQIGHPDIDKRKEIAAICNIEPCTGDPDVPFEGYDNYWDYISDKFDVCLSGDDERTEMRRKCMHKEYMNASLRTPCRIIPDYFQFARIEDPYSVKDYKFDVKWKDRDETDWGE